jgi:hypothetical protein
MASKKVKVTYKDGREEVVAVTPRANVMTEEYCGGMRYERAILATYYMGWAALNRAGKESSDFETFLDAIDDVEDVEDEKPDPTQPAPSDGESSD